MPFMIPLAIPLLSGAAAGVGGMAAIAATPTAITAMGATGLGLGVLGQFQAGRAAEAQAESQAAWHEYSARLSEREARETQEAAAYEEEKLRKAGVRLKATQRARYAKAGVMLEGSPEDVLVETAEEIAMDALMIRRGGMAGAQRYTAEAALERMAGKSALLKGRAARRASYWGMGATALTGAAELSYRSGLMKGKYP